MRVILPPGDEGTLIYGAVRVAQGQVPYRDFFETMGPGTFYWVALFFKIFGITWIATRVALMITCVATALTLFFLARRLRTGSDAYPAIFMIATLSGFVWPVISHHEDSNLLALLSFAAFVLWLDKHRPALMITAGALAALTTCFLQPKGILLLVAFLLLLGIMCRREAAFKSYVGHLVSGYSAVSICVLLLFGLSNGLHDFLYANFVWPLTRYSTVNSVSYALGIRDFHWKLWAQPLAMEFSPAVGYTVACVLTIPFLTVALLPIVLPIVAACQRSKAFSRDLLPFWVAGWALWLSEIHRKDMTHLICGSPLLIILFFCLLRRPGHATGHILMNVVATSVVALAVFNVCLTLAASTKVQTARGSVYMFREDPILTFLATHIQPGEKLFAYSYCPMYYFLTGADNPTKYSILMYQMNTEAQFLDAARSLEKNQVRYVVWDNVADDENENVKKYFPKYHPPRKDKRVVEKYIMEHFHVVYSQGGVRVLERQGSANPARASQEGEL
jgi:hypothetical protein